MLVHDCVIVCTMTRRTPAIGIRPGFACPSSRGNAELGSAVIGGSAELVTAETDGGATLTG